MFWLRNGKTGAFPNQLDDERPLRAELYSVDQLARHGRTIAATHRLATEPTRDQLIQRLNENERILIETYELVTSAVMKNRRVAPAAEWLLDNFYLIEEQIRTARRHLPSSYSRELPRLTNGPASGYPRAYGIALELVSHVDGRVDAVSLNGFIASYQALAPLKLGELWAIPIMLRLALIENLRRVATRIAATRRDRDIAGDWAERMVQIVEQNPGDLILVMADMARANPPLSGAFLAELTRHLQGQSPYFVFANTWLGQRISEQGLTIEQLVLADGQAQAADQVSIGNSITSLRFLSSNDWREFVEEHSLMEKVLRNDPARVYAGMDFLTRDRYRHVVEEIAKRSHSTEDEVARRAIGLAQTAAERGKLEARASHVGFYLIDKGRLALERSTQMRRSLRMTAVRICSSQPLLSYLIGVLLVVTGVTAAFLTWSAWRSVELTSLCVLAVPFLMCAAQLSIAVVNWLATLLAEPRPLPRMDFTGGIPPEHRTMVVVPTMLSSTNVVAELLEGLEVRYLANRDTNLHFALLTDFADSAQEVQPSDEELLRLAREGVWQLNQKYESDRSDIFYLAHRPRRWNAREGVWMGYERKRGKLLQFNSLLRGGPSQFSEIVGDPSVLSRVRYVITLDTDTELPPESARELVGAMAHTLNRPVFDPKRGRIVAGYGILQPRVGVSLPNVRRSWFSRFFAGDAGVDPYTRVVSDVYQDLFDEGSFIGKGIYDVDAFLQSCESLPENAILSHDLLEGAYARSGLLSDIELYEEYPSRYGADINRRHRWIRGDWQIAGWILPRVPGRKEPRQNEERRTKDESALSGADSSSVPPPSGRVRNPISALSKWKIFDNIRRSLMPIAMLALLLGSWLLAGPALGEMVVLFVLAVVGTVPLVAAGTELISKPAELPWLTHLRVTAGTLCKQLAQVLFGIFFLPYEAFISLDAIGRSLVRMFWTKKRLLEWQTSSDAQQNVREDLLAFFRLMWFGPAISVATFALVCSYQVALLPVAGPLLALWFASPVVAWWLSRQLTEPPVRLTDKQRVFLGKLSRRTWRYFEVFANEQEHWLPPDNYQDHPAPVVAPRTSPTNVGVALLANLAACDFGYSPVGQLLDRTQKLLGTLARMERHRGHFFNWYDTRSLKALLPRYISTVDSGNLAGGLLVLRAGLLEMAGAGVLSPRAFDGLRDTVRVLLEAARGYHRMGSTARTPLVSAAVLGKIERLEQDLGVRRETLSAAAGFLQSLAVSAAEIADQPHADAELRWWAGAFEHACVKHRDDLLHVVAWAGLSKLGEESWQQGSPDQIERLARLRDLLTRLEEVPNLREIAALREAMLPLIDAIWQDLNEQSKGATDDHASQWFQQLRRAIVDSSQHAAERIEALEQAAQQCQELAELDFSFLFDASRDLFAIGFNVSEQRLDASYYDLLASEARLASFIAIAQGQVGQSHWFALGRLLTTTGGAPTLLSWSGSMFEYLMPLLVMPTYENTLLDQSYKSAVHRQMNYGRQRGVPWGLSESGYNSMDVHMNYQYRAFGVPGLGLKRGLAEDLVVAPYASVLALMAVPEAACRNLERLDAEGRQGAYGLYEAVDYTPSRLPRGATSATVRQFMAHHEGMSLLALAYVLLDRPMQRRFVADPTLRAVDLLLQERVPKAPVPIFPHVAEARATRIYLPEERGAMRVFTDPSASAPEVNLLSNGRYHVVITSAGGGYSRWRDLSVTRWREDPTRDCWGSLCYLRDLDSGLFWSTAWQPTQRLARRFQAVFTQGRAEFRRRDDKIDTHTEISVSPEDDIELRRITISNRSDVARTIEVTSYAEVVLAPQAHDLSHPAFNNLFVQTELVRERQAIFCTRRPRSADERPPWLVHLMAIHGTTVGTASYETDRMRFIGRGRTLIDPVAMEGTERLSDSHGSVLDPIICIRHVIRLEPNEMAKVDLVTGVAESRPVVAALAEKYHDSRLTDRVFELSWTHSHILLQQLNATEADAQAYSRLASAVVYASALRRAMPSVMIRNRRGQSGLWGYGISGDLPIVLVRIRNRDHIALVRQAVLAHAYWRMRGLSVDLVIWNEDDSVYRQALQDTIMDLVAASPEAALVDKAGGVFVRRGEQMSEEDRTLLQTVARVILIDDAGTLSEQAERRGRAEVFIPALRPSRGLSEPTSPTEATYRDLAFYNGFGGFSRDGREYVTILRPRLNTPAPWVNVIANSQFGTVVSESGSVYTWSGNSHEYRLTPWHNDPVTGASGEAVYIRDEETGRFWSPSPLPTRGRNLYVARHGFGYSMFEYEEDGIVTELSLYVATDAPVKFARIKVTNGSGRPRQLSLTSYWEWVLGEMRDRTLMHVVTQLDSVSGALFARNPYSTEFGDRIAFVDCSESQRTVTGDRTEFLGRNGTPASPAAMGRVRLSGRVGAGFDPCAAIQVPVALAEGQDKDIVFIIGAAGDEEHARQLAFRFRGAGDAYRALEAVWHYWSRALGVAYFETPEPAVNFLVNGWLVYQTLSCRMWARTGFYQSGGAFGFRDQLQDAMAIVHAEPGLAREHLLRAAARQFIEGDVQHWWHPPVGRGVRTRFSDDYLWLPYATCRYVSVIGDTGVLDERVPFLRSRELYPEEESNYDLPQISETVGTLYEHCLCAIDHGLRFGTHGLPLMGSGDWNDGMNLVGHQGKGESVWLAFFLFDVLTQFTELARRRGDVATVDKYTIEAGRLRGNIEAHGWDGEWYRRAYFDDGTPLGSASSPECQIDSLSQSWSILSGAGTRERSLMAIESVDRRLVHRHSRLVQLLDTPFDKSELNPGYIKGYVPGVRENGGQYTHAVIWTIMALAAIGDSKRAWELLHLINPLTHGDSPETVSIYRVEPYVVAADVYAVRPHTGRGGWTWYTGSASWMYRLITESLLGLRLQVDRLVFAPCLPAGWSSFRIHYRYRETFYHITLRIEGGGSFVRRVVVDGNEQTEKSVHLIDDRMDHQAEVEIG